MAVMCGRYASFLPAETVVRLFHTVNPLPNVAPSWHVASVTYRRSAGIPPDVLCPGPGTFCITT
jgi:hypothetical protein